MKTTPAKRNATAGDSAGPAIRAAQLGTRSTLRDTPTGDSNEQAGGGLARGPTRGALVAPTSVAPAPRCAKANFKADPKGRGKAKARTTNQRATHDDEESPEDWDDSGDEIYDPAASAHTSTDHVEDARGSAPKGAYWFNPTTGQASCVACGVYRGHALRLACMGSLPGRLLEIPTPEKLPRK